MPRPAASAAALAPEILPSRPVARSTLKRPGPMPASATAAVARFATYSQP
ncbi:Uncharacterised protein [Mycobacteroides abscessus subsp. abscessus]|nr:Uncharacterised protein [Mycobacteroides abscessus subsp. abscessus]